MPTNDAELDEKEEFYPSHNFILQGILFKRYLIFRMGDKDYCTKVGGDIRGKEEVMDRQIGEGVSFGETSLAISDPSFYTGT